MAQQMNAAGGDNAQPRTHYANFETDLLANLTKIEDHTNKLLELIPKQTAVLKDVYKHAGEPSRPTPGPRTSPKSVDSSDKLLRRALMGPGGRRGGGGGAAEWDEAQSGVFGGGSGPGSASPSSSRGWLDQVKPSGSILPLPHMQGAIITPADQLNYLSSLFANMANKKRAPLQAQLNDMIATGRDSGPAYDALVAQLSAPGLAGGRAGRASNALSGLASGYAQGKYITSTVKNLLRPIHSARELGYATGYQGGGAGFMGVRGIDGATLAGMGQHASALGFAANNNVTPGQADTIYSNLFANGWNGGTQTNNMRNAAAKIMNNNPYIGSMPQTYTMMDQATRMGTTSLTAFVNSMKSVPDAMLAANTSISQTMSDMQVIGAITKSQGSTVQQGYNLTQAWQRITGLPGASLAPMLTSPMVQGQTYMNTGMMPSEQGLVNSGSRISAIMQSVNRMYNTITPQGKKTINGPGGFKQTISTEDQKFALMAQFFPGMDSSTLKKMYKNQAGITAGSNMQMEMDAWRQAANGQSGNTAGMNALLGRGGKGGNWGAMLHSMQQARYIDANGNIQHMYSNKQIRNVEGTRQKDITDWVGSHPEWQGAGGQNQATRVKQLMQSNKLPPKLAERILNDRENQMKSIMAANTKSQSNPGDTVVTMRLSAAAQKLFSLSEPKGSGKAAGNAGQININVPYANGPTSTPMADMNAAGTASSAGAPGSAGATQAGQIGP